MKKIFENVFSYNGILLIPVMMIIFLVWSGYDNLMSRLGFETTTNLKSQLTELKGQFKTLQKENEELKERLKTETYRCEILTETIAKQAKEDEEVDLMVDEIILDTTLPEPVIESVPEHIEILNEEVASPPHNRNIAKINLAYNKFFGG